MTSYDVDKEDVCLIEAGEHPRVKHKTCVNYRLTRFATLEQLDRLRDTGYFRMRESVSEAILRRIRRGVAMSQRIGHEHIVLMNEQDLLD